MKLALGTVQFGQDYGAFNKQGQPSTGAVAEILAQARAAGVDLLDTAHAYGESEEVLGRANAWREFRLVTKLPPLGAADDVHRFFADSLRRLGAPKVYGLLLHRASDLLGSEGPAIWAALQQLRDGGKVEKIGVSVYGPDDTLPILERFAPDLVQLPMNVFDRRHLQAGVLDRCRQAGIEVHVRSAFLQGFALSDPAALPEHLQPWRPLLAQFRARCDGLGLSPLQGALAFACGVAGIHRVVVGVDGVDQLRQILASASGPVPSPGSWDGLACDDMDLIDPSRWRRARAPAPGPKEKQ